MSEDDELIARLRSSAKAFRENPIYTQDGDPVFLAVQAEELEQAAARLSSARKQAIEEAARVAEGYPSPLDDLPMALAVRGIAQAIRNLLQEDDNGKQ